MTVFNPLPMTHFDFFCNNDFFFKLSAVFHLLQFIQLRQDTIGNSSGLTNTIRPPNAKSIGLHANLSI